MPPSVSTRSDGVLLLEILVRTCSATPCTPIMTRKGTAPAAVTATARLRKSAKPESDAFTWYDPGGRFRKCASPFVSVTVLWFCGPSHVDCHAGNTAPVPSCTVTSMRPVNTWADAEFAVHTNAASAHASATRQPLMSAHRQPPMQVRAPSAWPPAGAGIEQARRPQPPHFCERSHAYDCV